ncbi:integrin alpha-4-like [Patella vulgata]|uniref:integrin alpha-4-like n=1 Tax=Patella vulgata TaxID=6465 RepID=UPI0024A9EC3E|nr:integrin alpha-4-like [Patella vulgata]
MPIMLSGSNTAFSRFGSSISNLGDVNGDGIDDIAVGAKDENGVGAVYIYHGSADGQIVEYSQRITGEMVSENITGFGSHISKPLDVDDNGYPDIAIGCISSDKAVLLRTRPIIDLVADLNFDSELINLNRTNCPAKDDAESCIVLTLCFNYSQISAPEQIEMDFNISVDILKRSSLRRVQIHTEDGWFNQISEKLLVERGKNNCKRFDLITRMEERLQDPFTAVRVEARFKLNESSFDPGDIKPIINQTRPNVLTKDTRFQLSCGEDNICEADLGIKGEFAFSEGELFITINQTEIINLDVRLVNYGENSFGSKVNFYWNENLSYRTVKSSPRWPIECTGKSEKDHNYKLTCTVFPPINRNQTVKFSVLLEGDALSLNNAKVNVSIQAQTASPENNKANNVANFSSDVWIVASPGISG